VTHLTADVRDLLEDANYAHLATVLPDGAPYTVPVASEPGRRLAAHPLVACIWHGGLPAWPFTSPWACAFTAQGNTGPAPCWRGPRTRRVRGKYLGRAMTGNLSMGNR
jgi:hypothetical protein